MPQGGQLIYGLNMGKGTAEDAAAEADYVMNTIGQDRLIAFQLANEPDLFHHNGIRSADYNVQQFSDEWQHFFNTIRARNPNAPFAGPDTAYGQDWLVPFASRFRQDLRFISSHYYAEGPPTDPSMTIERLLANPKLAQQLDGLKQVSQSTALPFRLAETNSCYAAGKQGVSNTFASALWGADLMYQLAQAGAIGVNLHGGGYGWYTPIAGAVGHGFIARPIFYGMLLFAQTIPGQLIEARLDPAPADISAYAVQMQSQQLKLAIFNKNLAQPAHLTIPESGRLRNPSAIWLYAPSAQDTDDTTFAAAPVGASGAWSPLHVEQLRPSSQDLTLSMPPASAVLLTLA